jgi:hypothetical protein
VNGSRRHREAEQARPSQPGRVFSRRYILGLAILAALICLSIPCILQYQELSRRAQCMANLNHISRAWLKYADGYHGPAMSFDEFVQAAAVAYLQPEQLFCAESGEAYVYVVGPGGSGDPRDILAYEPPEYHGGAGGMVLFRDGSVKWRTATGQQIELDATLERLNAATTQPTSQP